MAQKHWGKRGHFHVAGVLDIGTSKTVCLIAAISSDPETGGVGEQSARVIGIAQHRSHGVTSGVVTDLDQAEEVTRATIAEAEAMAGVTLDEIAVSVSGAQLLSHNFRARSDVTEGIVSHHDLARLHSAGHGYAKGDGRSFVYLNHFGYQIDGRERVDDPRGMKARCVTADWHAVTADDATLHNLLLMIERCYLRTSHLFVASQASSLAVTTEEERQVGVTCIDFGGGTTTFSVFNEDRFLFQDSVAMGANHITFDIARALQSPLAEAERIKALYGSAICAQSDAHETFSYTLLGEEDDDVGEATKAELSDVVRRGFTGLTARVKERLHAARVAPYMGDQIVITGGGSQLVGACAILSEVFGKRVRVAGPRAISGLPQVYTTPAFATVVGLIEARLHNAWSGSRQQRPSEPMSGRYIDRVGAWLKRGF